MSGLQRNNSRTSWANTQPDIPDPPIFLVVEHNGRKVTILRNPNYQETIASIKKNVHGLRTAPNGQISILAHLEEVGDHVQITEDVWPQLLPRLLTIRVELDNEADTPPSIPDAHTSRSHQCPNPTPPHVQDALIQRNSIYGFPGHNLTSRYTGANIFVKTLTGKTINFIVDLSACTVDNLKGLIQDREGVPSEKQRLLFAGWSLEDNRMLTYYGISDKSTVHLMASLRGGKPVIYLFPPSTTIDIRVRLCLVQSWSFSDIYPPTTISTPVVDSKGLGQAITWTVNAQPDGTLWDQATGREVAYLFWEAHTNPRLLLSPPTTRPGSPIGAPSYTFDPASPALLPNHSALLPFDKVTGYIDDALSALGLHTEARTSFITYWLPDLSKHAFIALRFLPQEEYEQAAPLNVTPTPEVVTRVFMLFRGVEECEVGLWSEAEIMARKDVAMWRDVVGVDIAKAHNSSLFRVLEWGGMEVK